MSHSFVHASVALVGLTCASACSPTPASGVGSSTAQPAAATATQAAAASGTSGATAPATPPALAPDIALRWRVSQGLWGTEVFEVTKSGKGSYSFRSVRPGEKEDVRKVTVPPAALARIAEAATRSSFCAERSSRRGIPDEGQPTLELALDGVACAVTLWDGEWRDRPGPKEVARLVRELHQAPR